MFPLCEVTKKIDELLDKGRNKNSLLLRLLHRVSSKDLSKLAR